MSSYPNFVELYDEGPREGFQIESEIYPIEQRVALINAPGMSCLPGIQVGSFVIEAARFAQDIPSRTLAGKVIRSGSFSSFRQSSAS